jgi:hypothetical protein
LSTKRFGQESYGNVKDRVFILEILNLNVGIIGAAYGNEHVKNACSNVSYPVWKWLRAAV